MKKWFEMSAIQLHDRLEEMRNLNNLHQQFTRIDEVSKIIILSGSILFALSLSFAVIPSSIACGIKISCLGVISIPLFYELIKINYRRSLVKEIITLIDGSFEQPEEEKFTFNRWELLAYKAVELVNNFKLNNDEIHNYFNSIAGISQNISDIETQRVIYLSQHLKRLILKEYTVSLASKVMWFWENKSFFDRNCAIIDGYISQAAEVVYPDRSRERDYAILLVHMKLHYMQPCSEEKRQEIEHIVHEHN